MTCQLPHRRQGEGGLQGHQQAGRRRPRAAAAPAAAARPPGPAAGRAPGDAPARRHLCGQPEPRAHGRRQRAAGAAAVHAAAGPAAHAAAAAEARLLVRFCSPVLASPCVSCLSVGSLLHANRLQPTPNRLPADPISRTTPKALDQRQDPGGRPGPPRPPHLPLHLAGGRGGGDLHSHQVQGV
jgi:hypothetical protein